MVDEDQLALGRRLLGNVVRFNHMPPGSGHLCVSMDRDGMVEIEGFSGFFAPHLFEIDGETTAVPVIGKVD